MNEIKSNWGREFDEWINSIDMSGPTPGAFRLSRDGKLNPVNLCVMAIVYADRARLIDPRTENE